jgi:hypothetical protein
VQKLEVYIPVFLHFGDIYPGILLKGMLNSTVAKETSITKLHFMQLECDSGGRAPAQQV